MARTAVLNKDSIKILRELVIGISVDFSSPTEALPANQAAYAELSDDTKKMVKVFRPFANKILDKLAEQLGKKNTLTQDEFVRLFAAIVSEAVPEFTQDPATASVAIQYSTIVINDLKLGFDELAELQSQQPPRGRGKATE